MAELQVDLSAQIETLQSSKATLESQLQEMVEQNASLQSSKLECTNQNLESIRNLENQISDLKVDNEQRNNTIHSLEHVIARMQAQQRYMFRIR